MGQNHFFQWVIPPTQPTWAVLAGERGEPRLVPVSAIAVVRMNNKTDVVVGLIGLDHFKSADHEPDFVGYAHAADPAPWADACAAKRKGLDQKVLDLGNARKIIIPDAKLPTFHP